MARTRFHGNVRAVPVLIAHDLAAREDCWAPARKDVVIEGLLGPAPPADGAALLPTDAELSAELRWRYLWSAHTRLTEAIERLERLRVDVGRDLLAHDEQTKRLFDGLREYSRQSEILGNLGLLREGDRVLAGPPQKFVEVRSERDKRLRARAMRAATTLIDRLPEQKYSKLMCSKRATPLVSLEQDIEDALTKALEPRTYSDTNLRLAVIESVVLAAERRTLRRALRGLAKESLGNKPTVEESLALKAPAWRALATDEFSRHQAELDLERLAAIPDEAMTASVDHALKGLRGVVLRGSRAAKLKAALLQAAISAFEHPFTDDWQAPKVVREALSAFPRARPPRWRLVTKILNDVFDRHAAPKTQETEWSDHLQAEELRRAHVEVTRRRARKRTCRDVGLVRVRSPATGSCAPLPARRFGTIRSSSSTCSR